MEPIDQVRQLSVSIDVAPDVASIPAVQQTAWMTLNILARLERVIREVTISCPDRVERVVPLGPNNGHVTTLAETLRAWARAIDTVPVRFAPEDTGDFRLAIGPGPAVAGGLRVHGQGWCGGFSSVDIELGGSSRLPFGPYMAASLVAGEVFKRVRIDPARYPLTHAAFYDLWHHRASEHLASSGPSDLPEVKLRETLVGVGAVGCISALTLWATPGLQGDILLIDGDEKGIDKTNLNRYLLFNMSHLGLPKASTCRDLLNGEAMSWRAEDQPFELADVATTRRILCAVDTPSGRLAVQNRWPESLLMASTHELRSELVRCDPRTGGPCARCYNDPETGVSDDDLRRRFREAPPQEQQAIAAEVGADLEGTRRWAEFGECGTSGDRVKDALRGGEPSRPEAFAVPFASCAAGVMLAAEVVKEAIDAPVPLSPRIPRASLQFWNPHRSAGAKPYLRDPRCPLCRPDSDGAKVWHARMAHRPSRGDPPDHPSQPH